MKKIVYQDEESHGLEFCLNGDGDLFINVGRLDEDYYNGYIVLDKADVEEIIKDFTEILNQMR